MVLNRLFIKLVSLTLLNSYCSLRTFSEAGAETVAVFIADELCLAIYYLDCALGAGWNAESAAVAFLLVNFYYFPQRFCCHLRLLKSFYRDKMDYFSPFNAFHLSSPRHWRAEAHQSIQEGIFSLWIYLPHLGHFTLSSSEKISTLAPQFGHLYSSTRKFLISCPGHWLDIIIISSIGRFYLLYL